MRTEIEALKEIRDRISYFCSRTDGKYDPPWAQEVIGIIDDVLITPYRQYKRFGSPFYVEVGTSIVAIRCASNHDVVWRADHSVHGKSTVDWAESVCTRMNQEAHKREAGDCAKLREVVEIIVNERGILDFCHNNLGSKTLEDWDNVYKTLRRWIDIDKAMSALAEPSTAEKSSAVGDAAKLREALSDACYEMFNFLKAQNGGYKEIANALDKAKAALAAPPRNCDVGTADDWLARFNVVCERCSGSDCDHRLFKDEEVCDCFARWLQMPYEEGGAK